VSCYCNPTFEIRIGAKREDLKFFGALTAPVELLSCVWDAMFRIAARFNTRGGDALSLPLGMGGCFASGPFGPLIPSGGLLKLGTAVAGDNSNFSIGLVLLNFQQVCSQVASTFIPANYVPAVFPKVSTIT
jgi:hypothetical protein